MMARRARGRKAGFTLIEVMVAMVILVALVGAIYTSFVAVADSAEIARSATEELRIQQYLREHFGNHLAAVHASVFGEYALIGEDGSAAYGPADTLTFVTSLPTSGAKSLPGIVKTVKYHIDDPSVSGDSAFQSFAIDTVEEKPSVTLFITEQPLVLGENSGDDFFSKGDEGLWQREIPIRSINFEYYDGIAEDWKDEWNSTDLGFLPWAIRVGVNLAKTEDQLRADLAEGVGTADNPDLSMLIVLPTGAGVISEDFVDPNRRRSLEFVGGASSIFD